MSLERIRAKITELEEKLVNLRIAERELLALEEAPSRKPRGGPKLEPDEVINAEPTVNDDAGGQPTISATVIDILSKHGSLTVPGIAEHVATTGRDISNRAISFALQGLKKRAAVKSIGGEWTLVQSKRKRARA